MLALTLVTTPFTPTSSADATDAVERFDCLDKVDLGLVIDRSGSMVLDTSKPAGKLLSAISLPETQTGLVSFNHKATLDQKLSPGNDTLIPDQVNVTRDPVDLLKNPSLLQQRSLPNSNLGPVSSISPISNIKPNVHQDLKDAIEDLKSGGNTAIGKGLDLSHQDFNKNGNDSATQIMVLFSDGLENQNSNPVQEAQEAKDDGIIVVAIAVGSETHNALLKDIASPGQFYKAADAQEAKKLAWDVADSLNASFSGPIKKNVPQLSSIGFQGMLQGIYGWTDHAYDFGAAITDPSNDPVETTWEWSDGTVDKGDTATKELASKTSVSSVLHLVDDPQKCMPDLRKNVPVKGMLQTVGPITPSFGLSQGQSCHSGAFFATDEVSTVGDLIAGSCSLTHKADTSAAPDALPKDLTVSLDGSQVATAEGGQLSQEYDATEVPDGEHTLTSCATAVNDTYDREFCTSYTYEDVDCTNALPSAQASGDGMLDGLTGWAGYAYDLQADATDPNGDPVEFTWTWPNGEQDDGDEVTRTFHTVGKNTIELKVTDDPSSRCPELKPFSSVETTTFETVDDWTVALDLPEAGADRSCHGVSWVPTPPTAPNSAAGRCPVSAHVDAGGPLQQVAQGQFQVKDQQGELVGSFGADSGTALEDVYESVDFPSEQLRLGACFSAVDDKHDRVFCSGEYTFYNVGAGLE